jgi:hypothetical protein
LVERDSHKASQTSDYGTGVMVDRDRVIDDKKFSDVFGCLTLSVMAERVLEPRLSVVREMIND